MVVNGHLGLLEDFSIAVRESITIGPGLTENTRGTLLPIVILQVQANYSRVSEKIHEEGMPEAIFFLKKKEKSFAGKTNVRIEVCEKFKM